MLSYDSSVWLPIAIALVLGITIHEFAHAYVAYSMGDMTPKIQGRVTLNPLAHLTLWGSLFMVLVGFGWGRPVEHRIWDHRRRLWVALAGPASNVLLAALFAIPLRLDLVPAVGPEWFYLPAVFSFTVQFNILLAVFNMLPLSPLDGSAVFAGILPDPWGRRLADYNARYPMALIVVFFINFFIRNYTGIDILWTILGPPINFLTFLLLGR